ncbi:MAG: hypothetical protein ACI4EI_08825, partial [Muricoprocola sp.]
VYICAASGDTNGILLTNYASENETSVSFWLKFNGKKRSAVITRRNAEAPQGTTESCYLWMGRLNVELEPNEIVYIELK